FYKFKTGRPPRTAKLDDRWLGPYRIRKVAENSMFYRLEELDEVPLATTIAGDHIKKFFSRGQLQEDHAEQLEYLHAQQAATAERQARSTNPTHLRELLDMIDNARNNGNNEEGRGRDGDEGNDEVGL